MRTYLAFLFSALALVGCGGGGSDAPPAAPPPPPPPPPSTVVSGTVFASDAFTSGVVKAYDFTNGVKGSQLASANLGAAGAYQLTITGTSGAILIEADSGCYVDKGLIWDSIGKNAYRAPDADLSRTPTVCASTPSLSAAVPFNATPLTVAITPYTHAAVGLAQYQIRTNGTATTAALNDANGRLSAWVGANIITTLPALPVRSSATKTDPVLYGSLLAGIPTWVVNQTTGVFGTGSLTTLAFADAMKSDLAQDGVLNGTGRDAAGSAVPLTIGNAALSTSVYRHQLAVGGVLRIRAETEGARDSTRAEEASIVSFLPALSAYNDSTNSLLDASAVIPLDEGGPIVKIAGPKPNVTLSSNDGMDGYVYDIVGIRSTNTVLLIDGVRYTSFIDQYHANSFINTTVFSNGPHTLTIQATNNLGNVSSASVTVNFSN